MLTYFEKKISALFKYFLHPKREFIIENTLKTYTAKHHPEESTLALLKTKLAAEAVRIYPMIDDSILDARLQNATITFWVTAFAGCIVSLSLYFSDIITNIPTIFVPLLGSFAAWFVAVGTIPIFYNQRVNGAMESVVLVFEENKHENEASAKRIGAEYAAKNK
jgi:hypothetical protein